VAWLREPANTWDVAIVDLVLEPGGGSGFGVLQALRGRPVTKKAVVLTGTANPQVRQRCEEMGADGVFDKAMETEALLDYCVALARAAGGH
jgi:CheY-like chemotaxis protein